MTMAHRTGGVFIANWHFADWLPFLLQEGGTVIDLDTGKIGLEEPAGIRALTAWDEAWERARHLALWSQCLAGGLARLDKPLAKWDEFLAVLQVHAGRLVKRHPNAARYPESHTAFA